MQNITKTLAYQQFTNIVPLGDENPSEKLTNKFFLRVNL